MQGKGTEKQAKVSFIMILSMFTLFVIFAITNIGCGEQWEKEEKEYAKKRDAIFKYKEGDVVYLKPDSTIGVITDRTLWSPDRLEYRIRYSTKVGKLEYIDTYEADIFDKKY